MEIPTTIEPGSQVLIKGKIYRVDKPIGREPYLTRIHRVKKL